MVKPIERPQYSTKEERLAALKRAARTTNTALGMDGVTMASDLVAWKRASFGIPEVDVKLGGGVPHGNFTVIWGEPGSSKTTLAMYLAAKAQKEGKLVAWAALEPFDPIRAKQFGVNLEEMPVLQFPQAEQVLDVLIDYARNKLVDVFILDSIHSLAPKGMQENSKGEKSLTEETMAILARKLSEFFKIAFDPIKRSEMAVLLIGQTRMKVGFITIEALTGGNALHHAAKLIVRVRRGAKDDAPTRKVTIEGKKTETQIGFNCVFKLDKVQVPGCQPEQTVFSMPFYYESGFDLPAELKAEVAKEEAEIEAQSKKEVSEVVLQEKEAPKPSNDQEQPLKKRGRPKKVV